MTGINLTPTFEVTFVAAVLKRDRIDLKDSCVKDGEQIKPERDRRLCTARFPGNARFQSGGVSL